MSNYAIHSIDPLDVLSSCTSYFLLLVPISNHLVSLLVHGRNALVKARVTPCEYSQRLTLVIRAGLQGVVYSQ